MLFITVRQCIGEPTCADRETIRNYFRGAYIDLLQNEVRYDSRKFGAASIVKQSRSEWTPINTQMQVVMPYKVTRTEL